MPTRKSQPATVQKAIDDKVSRRLGEEWAEFTRAYWTAFPGRATRKIGDALIDGGKLLLTHKILLEMLEVEYKADRRDDYGQQEVARFMALADQMEEYLVEQGELGDG